MQSGESFRENLNRALQAFALHIERISQSSTLLLKDFFEKTDSIFTPLQRTLLNVLLVLLFCTIIIIGYSWKIYGKVINEKFVRPSKSDRIN